MKLRVLALDFDGTIAVDGHLDPHVQAAIEELRAHGMVVVLVTGRRLSDLHERLGGLDLFDGVVAENGAVIALGPGGRTRVLGPRCARGFVEALGARGVAASVGACVVELDARDAGTALEVLQAEELPLTLHFNRGRLMVLPQAVSKATGLREALRALRLSVHNAIGVGDAENDHELLMACEIGAAVAWGSPALRAAADEVVPGSGPADVADYLREVGAHPRIVLPPTARRRLLLGFEADGRQVELAVRGRNVLVAGDPRSGKSWLGGLLCEQLLLLGYCVCLIDPEGDYSTLEALPGVSVLGADERPPSLAELARSLRHADTSVVVDLVRLSREEKAAFVPQALAMLRELRRETGLPHRIVVDEAHAFLPGPESRQWLDPELAGHTLITYRVSGLEPGLLEAAECLLVTRETDPQEIRLLRARCGGSESEAEWVATLSGLERDEAVLLPGTREAGGHLRRFRLAPRLTRHVRHRHKYLEVPVSEAQAFRFAGRAGAPGPVVRTLGELARVLSGSVPDGLAEHIGRGDLSRWIENVFGDPDLAWRVRALEFGMRPDGGWTTGARPSAAEFAAAVARAVERLYRSEDLAPDPRPGGFGPGAETLS